MAICENCKGTGRRGYLYVEIHADGSRNEEERSLACWFCSGTGRIQTSRELLQEMETRRVEGLAVSEKR